MILAVGGGSTIDCSKAIAAVISNEETEEKLLMGHPLLIPRVSVLNPENTFSVPAYQTASGAADMISHILESYFDQEEAFVPDAIHIDFYDRVDKIPFDKLEDFFKTNLH